MGHSILIIVKFLIDLKHWKNKMGTSLFIFLSVLMVSSISCEDDQERKQRFSVFQIIKFKNEECVGSQRNGTCFTSAECEEAGGTEDGTCADGFGVCCSTILENGASTALNQSYIVQTTSTALTAGAMQYTICPCSDDVCRIRFDFTQFQLAAPNTGMGSANGGANAITGSAMGDCTQDQFSITGSNGGTPVICGVNQGQHMIVDTDGSHCATVNFGIGNNANQRQWDIKVTQYRCGEEAGGPPGCLQWHMARTGRFRSFNFPQIADDADVTNEVVHLSNANRVCYTACTTLSERNPLANPTNIAMDSFGISISPAAASQSGVETSCIDDYLEIVGGTTDAIAAAGYNVPNAGAPGVTNTRFCGRYLIPTDGTAAAAGDVVSVCSYNVPFRVGVNFDADEGSTNADRNVAEDVGLPGGIVGFSLCYTTPGA